MRRRAVYVCGSSERTLNSHRKCSRRAGRRFSGIGTSSSAANAIGSSGFILDLPSQIGNLNHKVRPIVGNSPESSNPVPR
jgi:hypothetical protein